MEIPNVIKGLIFLGIILCIIALLFSVVIEKPPLTYQLIVYTRNKGFELVIKQNSTIIHHKNYDGSKAVIRLLPGIYDVTLYQGNKNVGRSVNLDGDAEITLSP